MKGLASKSPTFARVGVSGRCARRYYGIASEKPYDSTQHDGTRKYSSLVSYIISME